MDSVRAASFVFRGIGATIKINDLRAVGNEEGAGEGLIFGEGDDGFRVVSESVEHGLKVFERRGTERVLFSGEVGEMFQEWEFIAREFASFEMETGIGIANGMATGIAEGGEKFVGGSELREVESRNPFCLSIFAKVFEPEGGQSFREGGIEEDIRANLENGAGMLF